MARQWKLRSFRIWTGATCCGGSGTGGGGAGATIGADGGWHRFAERRGLNLGLGLPGGFGTTEAAGTGLIFGSPNRRTFPETMLRVIPN